MSGLLGLPTFKDQVSTDLIETFFNDEEFADIHNINDKDMLIVLDNDELSRRKIGRVNDYTAGVYEGDLLFYVSEEVYGKRPNVGDHVRYDGAVYRVTDFSSDTGMYTIVLKRNTGKSSL